MRQKESIHIHTNMIFLTFFFMIIVSGCGGGGDSTGGGVPSAPSNVSADAGVREVNITWDTVSAADTYKIYWGTSANVTTSSSAISNVSTPYTHVSLTAGTTYYYRVAAVNSAGESVLSAEVSTIPTVTPAEAAADGIINIPTELATIQEGLDAADSGDTVLVDDGTYKENLIWPAIDGITLTSVNGPEYTVIDGNGENEVILIHHNPGWVVTTATVIEGFTITNGYSWQEREYGDYDGGGGIHVYAAAPTIRNNVIVGNHSAYNGGGIGLLYDSDATIENNVIKGNTSDWDGGGIYMRNDSNASLTDNTIQNNQTDGCGGGYMFSPTSTLTADSNNTVTGNSVYDCLCNVPPCGDVCDMDTDCPSGSTGGGGSSNDACDQCLAICSGEEGCCTGSGCFCEDECSIGCNEWYCTLSGDCWCIG